MNQHAEEMRAVLEGEYLEHYGMPRRSGRYPWGSGDEPYQHSMDWLARYDKLKASGLSQKEIAKELGYVDKRTGEGSPTILKAARSNEINIRNIYRFERAKSLQEDGLGWTEIGRKMGVPEGTVRGWFDDEKQARNRAAMNLALFIKKRIDEEPNGMVDIGKGTHLEMNVSREMMEQAKLMLAEEGYPTYKNGIPQRLNPGQQTNQVVVCKPGTQYKDVYDSSKIVPLNKDQYISQDGGDTFVKKFTYPESLSSKRLMIRYKDDVGPDGATGDDKDGLVELRRGVKDLSLGNDRYAQVRILVDGTHYIKGMAVYSDNMPDGVDVVFNVNKKRGMPMMSDDKQNSVLKPIKPDDPMNPFGSAIKDADQGGQYWYDNNTKLGLINKARSEGDWSEWKDTLPAQFLSKQSRTMAKRQLDIAKADKQAEFNDILEINNPTIKRKLLKEFADKCDAAAVDLKAAALPGQKYHAIVPVNSLKDNEIYAPGYANGSKVALIRYPHAGTFEIPLLTVNNRHALSKKVIGADSVDAVCISKRNADKLSGADFDGDTVMVIPSHNPGSVKIAHRDQLQDLVGFDPKMAYPAKEGMTVMTKKNTQREMGMISNLITDMTLQEAPDEDLAKAVKHSMVVIDAEKHKLDYKRSEIENNIAALKKRYQPKYDEDGNVIGGGGAGTIVSRSKGEQSVLARQGSPYTNIKGKPGYDPSRPEGAQIYKTADLDKLYKPVKTTNTKTGVVTLTTTDGKKIKYNPQNDDERTKYHPVLNVDKDTGEVSYKSRSGEYTYKIEPRTQKSTRMAETDDANTLVSRMRHPMELLYADYANSMKDMARKARLAEDATGKLEHNKSAKATYQAEYDSLMEKLRIAQLNAPREREVQRRMNAKAQEMYRTAKEEGRTVDKEDIKKAVTIQQRNARTDVGAVSRKNRNINITDREWEAIQAGAISDSKLKSILDNTDVDKLRQRAMPRSTTTLSNAQISRMKSLASLGYTLDEIAKKMGKSSSTISKYLKGKEK